MPDKKLKIATVVCNRVHYNESKKIFEALQDVATPAVLYHNRHYFEDSAGNVEYFSYSLFDYTNEKEASQNKKDITKLPTIIALPIFLVTVILNIIAFLLSATLQTIYEILNILFFGLPDRLRRVSKKKVKYLCGRLYDIWISKPLRSGFLTYIARIKMHQQRMRMYLKSHKVDVLILNEANTGYLTELYVREAHKFKIPVIVIPYTFCTPAEPAEAYYNNPAHDLRNYALKATLIKSYLPEWLYQHKNKTMLRLPLNQALVQKLFRIQSPQPWVQESTNAEAIISASQYDTDYLINNGIPAEQIKTIGIPNQDYLYKEYKNAQKNRARIYKNLGMQPREKLAVFAVPPNVLGVGQAANQVEFKSYDEIIDFWIKALCRDAEKNGWNILLAPHPTLDKHMFKKYETSYCKVSDEQTSKILPICDLFIASISTTIKWANACGIPVLNYDVYKLRYNDFAHHTATINTEDKKEYLAYQKKLFSDDEYLKKIKNEQKAMMNYWGFMDGQCTNRLINLLETLGKTK